MTLVEHAKKEFKVLGWPGDDEQQGWVCDNVLELLTVFSQQGHRGSSASYVLHLFKKLAAFDPISPLTGDDSEWIEVGDEVYQNNRDGSVFKQMDRFNGQPYWVDGKIFRDPDGSTWTNGDSFVVISFPWTKPKPEIIDRD